MSADSQPITRPASDVIYFAADLSATEQQQSCELLRLLGDAYHQRYAAGNDTAAPE